MKREIIVLVASYIFIAIIIFISESTFKKQLLLTFGMFTFMIFIFFYILNKFFVEKEK